MTDTHKPRWVPVESSKGAWGYNMYKCEVCGKETHIGLDIDYKEPHKNVEEQARSHEQIKTHSPGI